MPFALVLLHGCKRLREDLLGGVRELVHGMSFASEPGRCTLQAGGESLATSQIFGKRKKYIDDVG